MENDKNLLSRLFLLIRNFRATNWINARFESFPERPEFVVSRRSSQLLVSNNREMLNRFETGISISTDSAQNSSQSTRCLLKIVSPAMEFLKCRYSSKTVHFQIIKKLTITYLTFYKYNIETDRIIIFTNKTFQN